LNPDCSLGETRHTRIAGDDSPLRKVYDSGPITSSQIIDLTRLNSLSVDILASLDKDAASTLDDDNFLARGLRELAFLGYLALALYLLLSLATYSDADGGWSHSGGDDAIQNGGGAIGAWLADVCLYLIGLSAYLLPVLAALAMPSTARCAN